MAKTILITGATAGLGREVAADLGGRGHTVLVHGRDQGKVDEVVAELGGDARGYVADLSSLDEVRRLADEVTANEERLDVLVNNAGSSRVSGATPPTASSSPSRSTTSRPGC